MKLSILKISAFSLLAAALVVAPGQAFGQETKKEKPAAEKADPAAKKQKGLPLGGKITAVDKSAKTITVGDKVVQVTSETKITKAGRPATLNDAAVGEEVGISYVKDDAGKMKARSVRIGPKPEGEKKGKKKEKTAAQ
jgi:hypothetical protein